jgi:hypothetical protein
VILGVPFSDKRYNEQIQLTGPGLTQERPEDSLTADDTDGSDAGILDFNP